MSSHPSYASSPRTPLSSASRRRSQSASSGHSQPWYASSPRTSLPSAAVRKVQKCQSLKIASGRSADARTVWSKSARSYCLSVVYTRPRPIPVVPAPAAAARQVSGRSADARTVWSKSARSYRLPVVYTRPRPVPVLLAPLLPQTGAELPVAGPSNFGMPVVLAGPLPSASARQVQNCQYLLTCQ
jgi:hypothetical protein